ncbi:MAG: protein translocase subunit SecDF, partial [Hymenobacter sp.]
MRNKGIIIALTVIVSVLCAYFLFFTYISRGVQQKAVAYATNNGQLSETKRQHYLDSVWRAPVFGSYTYRDVKQSELGLGLDLKGGMHVTLEVSPVEIVRAMANNSKDPAFNKALADAQQAQQTNSGTAFTTLFYQAYQQDAPGKPLARLFANSVNKDRGIDLNSSDTKVLSAINKEEEDAIGRSFDILRKRVDKFGVNQPNIQRVKGTGRIQVELPGVDNPERVRKLLQGQAKLEFYEVWPQQEYAPFLLQLDQVLTAKEKAAAPVATATPGATGKAAGDSTSLAAKLAQKTPANKAKTDSASAASKGGVLTRLLVPSPVGLSVSLRDTAQFNRLLRTEEARATLPSNLALLWENKPQDVNGQQYLPLVAVKKDRTGQVAPPVSGEVVSDARQDYDQNGRPEVQMNMNANGSRKWAKMTGANIGKQVAVVLDDIVYSAPTVQGEITGGVTSITGNFTIEEAQDLAQVLKAGKLPAPTRIVEEAVVGPSLGQEAINQGLYSSLAGLLIIMLFMGVYYG